MGALRDDNDRTPRKPRDVEGGEKTVLEEDRALDGEGRGVSGGRARERQAEDIVRGLKLEEEEFKTLDPSPKAKPIILRCTRARGREEDATDDGAAALVLRPPWDGTRNPSANGYEEMPMRAGQPDLLILPREQTPHCVRQSKGLIGFSYLPSLSFITTQPK